MLGGQEIVVVLLDHAGTDAPLTSKALDVIDRDRAARVAIRERWLAFDELVAARVVHEDDDRRVVPMLDVEVDAFLGKEALQELEVRFVHLRAVVALQGRG